MADALIPEPIPASRILSPVRSDSASRDKVMGIEAGPTLPKNGNVKGTLAMSIPSLSQSIEV